MDTLRNIQKIAFFFFCITGIAHLISSLIIANEYAYEPYNIINKTLDMPFIASSILYAFTSLKISISENASRSKITDVILLLLGIALLGAIVYVNLFIPDK